MAKNIIALFDAWTSFTITLASLASGSARQASMIDNTALCRHGAVIYLDLMSGASAPTAGAIYEVYLIRRTDTATQADDFAGDTDAGITIEEAAFMWGFNLTNTTNKHFRGSFDTGGMGMLGDHWTIAVKNSSGQALNGTESNMVKKYQAYGYQIT